MYIKFARLWKVSILTECASTCVVELVLHYMGNNPLLYLQSIRGNTDPWCPSPCVSCPGLGSNPLKSSYDSSYILLPLMQSPGWLMLILTQFCSCFCWADEQKTICLFLINSNMRHGSGTINLSSIAAMSTWIVATQQKSLRGTMMEMECEARKIMIQQKKF